MGHLEDHGSSPDLTNLEDRPDDDFVARRGRERAVVPKTEQFKLYLRYLDWKTPFLPAFGLFRTAHQEKLCCKM